MADVSTLGGMGRCTAQAVGAAGEIRVEMRYDIDVYIPLNRKGFCGFAV